MSLFYANKYSETFNVLQLLVSCQIIIILIIERQHRSIPLQLQSMIACTQIRQFVSLAHLKNDFHRKRNVLIHHGLMGSCKNFKSISKNQSMSDYANAYLIDCRNHGQSPHTDTHTIDDLADDLRQFICQHKLEQQKRLTIMAHSMGGMAAMRLTEKYPELQEAVDRVILIDIYCQRANPSKQVGETGKMLKTMLEIDLNQDTQTVFKEIEKRAQSKDVAGLIKTNVKVVGENQHKWICNLQTIVKEYKYLNQFQLNKNNWRKPVEVVYGAKSNYVNRDQILKYKELYPQMGEDNFHKIENAGHWVHFENTTAFLKTIQEIMRKDE